jgi:carboxyl-terminal processing protease
MSSLTRYAALFGVLLFSCLCLAYVVGFGTYQLWDGGEQADPKPMQVFWEAWDRIEEYFYGELPSPQERTYGAIHAALTLLGDPYTIFVEPQPRELERDQMRGVFGGIGVTLWRDAEGRTVLSPYPDSPAERAGVRDGDILVAVDGEAVADGMTVDDIRARFHGEVGTFVTLTISRLISDDEPPTPPFDLTVMRDEIRVPSVVWRVLDQATDVGYIRIERFTERTSDEITSALQELLQTPDVSGLVLDLRNNAGGLITPAVATASQFLDENDGVVLTELYRDAEERSFPVQEGGIATDIPLVVLVNGGTASASEIVAGALQDHNRAPLVGESTYGKGSVQLIYDLSDGSSLHVTTAIWLTPHGHRIDGQGLTPDIFASRGDGSQDEQLNRAVGYLHSQ